MVNTDTIGEVQRHLKKPERDPGYVDEKGYPAELIEKVYAGVSDWEQGRSPDIRCTAPPPASASGPI